MEGYSKEKLDLTRHTFRTHISSSIMSQCSVLSHDTRAIHGYDRENQLRIAETVTLTCKRCSAHCFALMSRITAPTPEVCYAIIRMLSVFFTKRRDTDERAR